MCGIVGLVGKQDVGYALYDALTILQHRGQDAAGIVTCDGEALNLRKHNGLVRDVFRQSHMDWLNGKMGIGHVRYPTAGSASSAEAQPMYVNSPFGICLAHNGNLTNADELKADLFHADRRHISTNSDSEVLLNVLAHELQKTPSLKLSPEDVFRAIAGVHQRANGAYAAVALIAGHGLLGFRDPCGIRPLVYGKRETATGAEYMFSSESAALGMLGFELVADVLPGQAIYITVDGTVHTKQCAQEVLYSPCIFEYVYLARPDSVIDGISVYKARLKMGEKLADNILAQYPRHDIDVVIPIPETSCTAALPMAHRLKVKYREGLVKSQYIGRTFIMPGQLRRQKSVQRKFSPIELEFRGKNVLLVDDSIVRGTTSRQIVQLVREAGAKKVYLASAAPPVLYPNVYGIDMPAVAEFVAHNNTAEDLASYIGADWVLYQKMADLLDCVAGINKNIARFDASIFDGDYVAGQIDDRYLHRVELLRKDTARADYVADGNLVEMFAQHQD